MSTQKCKKARSKLSQVFSRNRDIQLAEIVKSFERCREDYLVTKEIEDLDFNEALGHPDFEEHYSSFKANVHEWSQIELPLKKQLFKLVHSKKRITKTVGFEDWVDAFVQMCEDSKTTLNDVNAVFGYIFNNLSQLRMLAAYTTPYFVTGGNSKEIENVYFIHFTDSEIINTIFTTKSILGQSDPFSIFFTSLVKEQALVKDGFIFGYNLGVDNERDAKLLIDKLIFNPILHVSPLADVFKAVFNGAFIAKTKFLINFYHPYDQEFQAIIPNACIDLDSVVEVDMSPLEDSLPFLFL